MTQLRSPSQTDRSSQTQAPRPFIVEGGVIAGNVTDKYASSNPLHRRLMDGFLRALDELVATTGATSVHEVGCGEGHLSLHLSQAGLHVRGSDFSTQVIDQARANVAAAQDNIPFKVASAYDLRPQSDSAELIVCCEVLEHLEEPDRALEVLSQLARPWLIVSVPREPLWRCLNMARGKYVGQLGNTPGHLNHWSARGFAAFLKTGVEVQRVLTPLPWTMALCRMRETHGGG